MQSRLLAHDTQQTQARLSPMSASKGPFCSGIHWATFTPGNEVRPVLTCRAALPFRPATHRSTLCALSSSSIPGAKPAALLPTSPLASPSLPGDALRSHPDFQQGHGSSLTVRVNAQASFMTSK